MSRKKKELTHEEFMTNLKNDEGWYVPNSVLLPEYMKCLEQDRVTDDMAVMFKAIATKWANKMKYKTRGGQFDKEDCIMNAVEECIRRYKSFDLNKHEEGKEPNLFGYFSSVCIRGLAKGWDELGYKDLPAADRVYISDNIYSI